MNNAATAVSDMGVLPVVAAGNDAVDACGISPAGADGVVTVGATDPYDQETDFSNFGPCLSDVRARQGHRLRQARRRLRHPGRTSMASPHVAGRRRPLQGEEPRRPAVRTSPSGCPTQSTKDVLKVSKGSPNALLHTGGL